MEATQTQYDPTQPRPGRRRSGSTRAAKRERQRQIHELVTSRPITSQQQLVDLLSERHVEVTQATVSRDITEMGLVKVVHDGAHVYASPEELVPRSRRYSDERLKRILADLPVSIGRSGLTLLLVSEAGTADAIAQAIDDSTLHEQEGTLAGDNTILVLFRDDDRLEAWRERFERLLPDGPLVEYTR